MLESMRNQAQSWLAKLLLGGIALSFVLWGVGDYFLGGRSEPVAEVDGKPITANEFRQALERQKNAYRQALGKQYSKELLDSLHLKDSTVQTLVNRRIMFSVASELGLAAPEPVVAASIRANPAFQSASGFDPRRYQILTRNMGFGSSRDYENDLRLNMKVDALQKALSGSARVSEKEIRERFDHDYEQRVLQAIIVDPDKLLDSVKMDEAGARAWYDSHKNDYRSPLRIRLNAVEINPDELAKDISVDEAELKAAYEERLAEFVEEEQRHARHILVRIGKDATAEAQVAARKRIEAIQARIKAGEAFAKVADEASEDAGAKDGGDLGWFRKGAMAPAFDKAVFSMSKGDTSDIVETQFGYHLIRLEGIRKSGTKKFDEVRDQLKDDLIRARAAEEAYKLSQDLDDALGMEDSLKAAAGDLNLKLDAIGPVSMDEAGANPLLSDADLRAKAFSTLPGQTIEIEETAKGHFVAFEVIERNEPEVMAFDKVSASAMADAKRDAARKEARKLADKIRQTSGKSLAALAEEYGQEKYISKPVRINGTGDNAVWLTPEALKQAFLGNQGEWLETTVEVPQGVAAIRVEKIIAAPDDEFDKQKANIILQVREAKGTARFARWMAAMRDKHEIEIYERALERY